MLRMGSGSDRKSFESAPLPYHYPPRYPPGGKFSGKQVDTGRQFRYLFVAPRGGSLSEYSSAGKIVEREGDGDGFAGGQGEVDDEATVGRVRVGLLRAGVDLRRQRICEGAGGILPRRSSSARKSFTSSRLDCREERACWSSTVTPIPAAAGGFRVSVPPGQDRPGRRGV